MTHVSPFQFTQQPDGSMTLPDFPNVALSTVEGQGSVLGRDWAKELDLPVYWEEWEALAKPRSDKHHGTLTFILMDEAPTRLPGHPRMDPRQITLPTACPLELGHQGFIIGFVHSYLFGAVPRPANVQGTYIIGHATFFDSALADKAIEGITQGVFTHVCPVVWAPPGVPIGTGQLAQVSLVPGDFPGCPNARILNFTQRSASR